MSDVKTEYENLSFSAALARGILLLVLGVFLLAFPLLSLTATTVLFSCLVIFVGIVVITNGVSLTGTSAKTWAKVLLVILGIILIILGICGFFNLFGIAIVMSYLIAIGLFISGISELSLAIFGGVGVTGGIRVLAAITGVLGLILGVFFIINPFASMPTLLCVIGIFALVFGIFGIITAIALKIAGKKNA